MSDSSADNNTHHSERVSDSHGLDPESVRSGKTIVHGVEIHDFTANEGYTSEAEHGAVSTGYGVSESVYGQGFMGVYWYGATSQSTHTDSKGAVTTTPNYEKAPHLYAQFGTHEGWTEHHAFQVVNASTTDTYASILGFGNDGVIVAGQAFAPGADASQSYLIPLPVGNHAGWDQKVDVRTFLDDRGGAIDLNHDGVADFIGMGPDGLVFAFGSEDASHHYGLGPLQTAQIHGSQSDFGRAQGWTDDNSLRKVVHDFTTGFDDVIAFGNQGVYVAMGQDPATHAGQPFGQFYKALDNFGADQGWTNDKTHRLIGDVNGDGNLDIVAFGFDNTFVALGSRDSGGNLHFSIDPTKTIHDFGLHQGWDIDHTVRELRDVNGTGHDSLVVSGAIGTHVFDL